MFYPLNLKFRVLNQESKNCREFDVNISQSKMYSDFLINLNLKLILELIIKHPQPQNPNNFYTKLISRAI